MLGYFFQKDGQITAQLLCYMVEVGSSKAPDWGHGQGKREGEVEGRDVCGEERREGRRRRGVGVVRRVGHKEAVVGKGREVGNCRGWKIGR